METEKLKNKRYWLLFYLLFSGIYFIWRILFTIPIGYGWFAFIYAIVLLIVEMFGMGEFFVHFLNVTKAVVPVKPEISDQTLYPDVDVFIATYNESEELLYKTIIGCKNMRYPDPMKVHIYLLDDGRRPTIQRLAERLEIHYLTRENNEHAKAGNLNHALSQTSSPYVVTLDADMIPMKNFLMESLPFFIENEQQRQELRQQGVEEEDLPQPLGFIQLPQVFYNADIFQYYLYSEHRIPNEQDYFYRDIQLGKNSSNSVIYGGSNTILSRAALDEIGGFVTGIITEDIATGMQIQRAGYLSYAIDSIQASGLAAHDLEGILKQRNRWARGCIQTFRRYCPFFVSGLTFKQRLNYTNAIFYWYNSLKRFIYLLAPILFAVFNIMVVKATLLQVLIFWLPMYVMTLMTLRRFSGNVRTMKWTNVYETILMPSLLPAVLVESIGIRMKKFEVTRKDKKVVHKNSDVLRLAIPHILFMVFTIIGMMRCIYQLFTPEWSGYAMVLFWLTMNSYALLMSIFFILGRPLQRLSDRFKMEATVEVKLEDSVHLFKVFDISEHGISLISNFPYLVDETKSYELSLTREEYTADFEGKLLRVDSSDDYRYVFKITQMHEKDYQEFIKILYDRVPHLPDRILDSSVINDIKLNICERQKKSKGFLRKLPRVPLLIDLMTTEGESVHAINFNYQYFLLEMNCELTSLEIPLLTHPEFSLQCNFVQTMIRRNGKYQKTYSLYEVKNYKEIPASVWKTEVAFWLNQKIPA
ncbi:glycosyltransferase [Turicibacter bilis]|uniref:cellulose synthase (UDP-forming) n=1 Tax=Turicibacter bilis TaxID=2735723 RepID=A0A9Q9CND0_9FIRM|nr:glycosyltransferase [Turicibacter bilis]MBS3198298.1 glycosyltransferase [Turicibacter bilis]MBS3200031.1 glycosyltransferase [Turicibacter bilis]UUF04966.1 glycosyltransferase [Turicibacter bilis]UUF08526.1 glycosyltransferase [Turicibacter bilis]